MSGQIQTMDGIELLSKKLENILNDFTRAINAKFNYLQIRAKANPSSKTITVYFDEMERNEHNAKLLVDMVEYVKTMVLAIE